jgi:hypothetical protein
MTLISPNRHLQSSNITVSLTSAEGGLVAFNFVSGSPNFYPNKPIALTVGSAVYQTVYKQVWNGTAWANWLDFGGADISAFAYPAAASLVDTFSKSQTADNENLTASDVLASMVATPQTIDTMGGPGIVTGLQALKASRNKIPVTGIQVPYANSALEYQCIGLVKVSEDPFQDIQDIRFTFDNPAFSASFLLKHSRNADNFAVSGVVQQPWSIVCEAFDNLGDPGLSLTLNIVRQYTGTEAIGIFARFANISSGNALQNYETDVRLYLDDVDSLIPGVILPANDGSPGAIGNFFWNYSGNAFNPIGNVSTPSTQDIPFTGVMGYTQAGPIDLSLVGFTKFRAAKIPLGTDLNSLSFPGIWRFTDFANIGEISNLPSIVGSTFTLEVAPLTDISFIPQTRHVIQRLETWYADGSSIVHSIVWERVSVASSGAATWSPWEQVGKAIHTHLPSDILTNANAMFVTQAEIDAWNAFAGSTPIWTSPVATINNLTGVDGTTTFVIATGFFYTKIAGVWTITSANGIPVADGTVTAPGLITQADYKKFNIKPFAVQAGTSDSWWFFGNDSILYGNSFSFLPADTFDFVKRSTPLSQMLGEKAIGFGFDDTTAYGASSIAIGNGITNSGVNAILLGSTINSSRDNAIGVGTNLSIEMAGGVYLGNWNNTEGLAFSVGNGTGSGTRSNLFGVTPAGLMVVPGGYSVKTKTSTDILMGDGSTLALNDLENQIISSVTSNGKLYLYLKSGFDTFELDWADGFVSQFGQFPSIQAHTLIGNNRYSVETLPIEVATQWLQTQDPDSTLPYIDPLSMELAIVAGSYSMSMQSTLSDGETTGYTLEWTDELSNVWATLATAGLDGTFNGITLAVTSVPNGLKLRVTSIGNVTTGPIYHIFNDAGTPILFDVDYTGIGEDPSDQQFVNKNLQAISYTFELSQLEALIIIS